MAPRRDDPPPLRTNDARPVVIGIVVWLVALAGLLPFTDTLRRDGHLWWIATCACGAGLGLLGLWYVRRRARAIARDEMSPGD